MQSEMYHQCNYIHNFDKEFWSNVGQTLKDCAPFSVRNITWMSDNAIALKPGGLASA